MMKPSYANGGDVVGSYWPPTFGAIDEHVMVDCRVLCSVFEITSRLCFIVA